MQDMPATLVEQIQPQAYIPDDFHLLNEEYTLPEGFVYLDEAALGIAWDAKYATEDNFTGAPVDGYEANRIAISIAACEGLVRARALAKEQGFSLLVWDAARPQRAVDRFVAWAQEPEDGKTREAHYPNIDKEDMLGEYIARRSGHSRGAAVDLTLVDEAGELVDMGGSFDLMDERSHHGVKGITRTQTTNRNLLKDIMRKAGFEPYASEWWHYALKEEPFPDQYFDFVISDTPNA